MNLPPDLIDSVTASNEGVDQVTESIFRDLAVNQYSPKGTARGGFSYFRFTYKEGNRVLHVHIPGGNVRSALAQSRAIEIQAKVSVGVRPAEIVEMIRKMSSR